MLFGYRAYKDKKIHTGKLEANQAAEVVAYLRDNSYFPISVKPISNKDEGFLGFIFDRVGFNDVVDLTRQLAIMLNAGLTLVDSFEILKKQTGKRSLLRIIEDIDKEIRGGQTFSSALQKYPHLFPNLYIALVKSGEASGKLSEILLKLAENLEKQREFQGKITGALIYPVIIVIAMIGVMFVMITFVIPKLLNLYRDFNIELPLTTQILIAVSSFSERYWPLIIAATIGAVFIVQNYLKTKPGRYNKDRLLFKLPVVGNVVRIASLVDATRTLSILIGSGVSILDALTIIIQTSDNMIYQLAFQSIRNQVEKGVALGAAMTKEEIFPPILVQMTTVGEQTGHLDDTLMRISRYFEMESEIAVKAMTTMIEPLILVVLGVGVGFLVMSVITPIYNLTNSIK